MTLAETSIPVPLVKWEDGTIRFVGSRIKLDLLVGELRAGISPAEFVEQHPTISLQAAYAAAAYYTAHQAEIDEAYDKSEREADAMEAAARSDPRYQELVARARRRFQELNASTPD
jgi:uncharacterized protein (DUF433 family)